MHFFLPVIIYFKSGIVLCIFNLNKLVFEVHMLIVSRKIVHFFQVVIVSDDTGCE